MGANKELESRRVAAGPCQEQQRRAAEILVAFFAKCDENGTGRIDREQFSRGAWNSPEACRLLGLPQVRFGNELGDLWSKIDKSNDDQLTYAALFEFYLLV